MLIADMGSVRPGVPTLTVALRGTAQVTLEVTTLAGAKHSGQYGGAAPDALIVILHALASLHDENGDVAVAGLRREPWTGAAYSEEEFRALAEIEAGLPLFGTGDLGSRLWSGPAITVTGIDVPTVENALNAVSPRSRASLNVRVHPEQDPAEAQAAVIEHPAQRAAVRDRRSRCTPGAIGQGFATGTSGPAYTAAREAMETAWGSRAGERGDGRLDPARGRAAGGGPGRRDPAARRDRRLQQHPRPGRARAARRAREVDRRGGGVLPALRGALDAEPGTYRWTGEPGPSGMPIRYQATKNRIQATERKTTYGSISETTVPIPASFR